jgi:hypothetical protein
LRDRFTADDRLIAPAVGEGEIEGLFIQSVHD